jgi:hypothetical protein
LPVSSRGRERRVRHEADAEAAAGRQDGVSTSRAQSDVGLERGDRMTLQARSSDPGPPRRVPASAPCPRAERPSRPCPRSELRSMRCG